MRSNTTGEPFQYHDLGVKPFRIPLTEKYTIEKVKPLHGTITLFGTIKQQRKINK